MLIVIYFAFQFELSVEKGLENHLTHKTKKIQYDCGNASLVNQTHVDDRDLHDRASLLMICVKLEKPHTITHNQQVWFGTQDNSGTLWIHTCTSSHTSHNACFLLFSHSSLMNDAGNVSVTPIDKEAPTFVNGQQITHSVTLNHVSLSLFMHKLIYSFYRLYMYSIQRVNHSVSVLIN